MAVGAGVVVIVQTVVVAAVRTDRLPKVGG